MVKKKMEHNCKGWTIAKGLVSLVLGISLWTMYMVLEEVVAIGLMLIGLNKLYHSFCC